MSTVLSEPEQISSAARAAALECKYAARDDDGKPVIITVPDLACAAHPQNRGGFYTQGLRCVALGAGSVNDCFSLPEAISRGVAVEEIPLHE